MQNNHHVGRLVRPVKFRNLEDDNRTTVAYLRLAVDEMITKKTTFLDYVAFGKTAEVLAKLTINKGDLVELFFTIQNNEYVDQVTQKKVFNYQNVISRVQVYHTSKSANQDEVSASSSSYPTEFDAPANSLSSSSNNPFSDFDTYTS